MQGKLVLFGPTNEDYSNELILADLAAPLSGPPAPAQHPEQALPLWKPGFSLQPVLQQSPKSLPELIKSWRSVQISPHHRYLAAIQKNLNPASEARFLEGGLNFDLLLLIDLAQGSSRQFHFPEYNYSQLRVLDFTPGEDALLVVLSGQPQAGGDFLPTERHALMLLELTTGSSRPFYAAEAQLLDAHFTRRDDRPMVLCRSSQPFAPGSADRWLFIDPLSGTSQDFDLFDYRDPLVQSLRMAPDGSAVAYVCLRDSQLCLMRYTPALGRHEVLTEFPLLEISLMPKELTWSPDASALAFQLFQPPAQPNQIVGFDFPPLGEDASEEDYQRLKQLILEQPREQATVMGYTRRPDMDLRGIWVLEPASRRSRRVVCCDEHFVLSWSQEGGHGVRAAGRG